MSAACDNLGVKAKLIAFGEIRIEGEPYDHDVVIDAGRVLRRRKGPSKALADQFGHTPLSVAEDTPWVAGGSLSEQGPTAGCPSPPMYTRRQSDAGSSSRRSPPVMLCLLYTSPSPRD